MFSDVPKSNYKAEPCVSLAKDCSMSGINIDTMFFCIIA